MFSPYGDGFCFGKIHGRSLIAPTEGNVGSSGPGPAQIKPIVHRPGRTPRVLPDCRSHVFLKMFDRIRRERPLCRSSDAEGHRKYLPYSPKTKRERHGDRSLQERMPDSLPRGATRHKKNHRPLPRPDHTSSVRLSTRTMSDSLPPGCYPGVGRVTNGTFLVDFVGKPVARMILQIFRKCEFLDSGKPSLSIDINVFFALNLYKVYGFQWTNRKNCCIIISFLCRGHKAVIYRKR